MKEKLIFVLMVGVFFCSRAFAADIYTIDPVHSTVGFKARHLGVSYVSGKFDSFEGQLTFDGAQLTGVTGKVNTNSINTANSDRDGHLKSDDFFSAEKFPAITFESTKVTQAENTLAVVGNLTIRDVTKVVVLQGEFGGFADTGKAQKAGLTLGGEINRKDFGLQFNKILDSGQAMVGDQVKITLELEAGSSK